MLEECPEAEVLLDAYFVLVETGLWPWEMDNDMPRQRFRQAVQIFAVKFGLHRLLKSCPLADALQG